jgi:cyclophilin family peptidyl-prolyl cis-trans isomerase
MAGGDKYGYIGSQFFICLSRLPAFDGKYTVIGKVDAGSIDKVQSIGKVEIDKNTDRPKSDVKVKKVTVSPK